MTVQSVKCINALNRYIAMIEGGEGLSGDALAQAQSDLDDYGAKYIASSHARPGLMVRFMCEVCDIPLSPARECVVECLRNSGAYRLGDMTDAEFVALRLYADNLDMVAAEAVGVLQHRAAKGTEWEAFWQEVLDMLRHKSLY